jgi:hypothetical protein
VVQIVTLSSSLTDTGEDRVTTVGLGDVVDQFLNQDGLADTGTTEQSNLTTSGVRGQQVDDLDTGLQDFGGGGLVNEGRRIGVDGRHLDTFDRASLVDGLTDDVHDSTEGLGTDGDGDGRTGVDDLLASDETIGTLHGDASDSVLTQVLGNFENESAALRGLLFTFELDVEGVQDGGQVGGVELDVDDGTDDGLDLTDNTGGGGGVGSLDCGERGMSAVVRYVSPVLRRSSVQPVHVVAQFPPSLAPSQPRLLDPLPSTPLRCSSPSAKEKADSPSITREGKATAARAGCAFLNKAGACLAAVLNSATFARAFLDAFAASRLANRWTDRVTSVILGFEGSFRRSVKKERERIR